MLATAALLGIWIYQRDNGPSYKGKTAREWFRQEVNWMGQRPTSDYREAVEQLHTNFIPVFIRAKPSRYMTNLKIKQREYRRKLPRSLQWLIPEPKLEWWSKAQDTATESMPLLREHWPASELVLKDFLAMQSDEWKQNWIWTLHYGYVVRDVGQSNVLTHADFTVRFYAAVVVGDPNNRNQFSDFEKKLSLPILVEAVTNAVMMKRTFGEAAKERQRMGLQRLGNISPETAAKYLKHHN